MDEQLLLEIRSAKDAVAETQSDLDRLMRGIRAALRAEKTAVSEALLDAFQKLLAARDHLVRLEKLARGQTH